MRGNTGQWANHQQVDSPSWGAMFLMTCPSRSPLAVTLNDLECTTMNGVVNPHGQQHYIVLQLQIWSSSKKQRIQSSGVIYSISFFFFFYLLWLLSCVSFNLCCSSEARFLIEAQQRSSVIGLQHTVQGSCLMNPPSQHNCGRMGVWMFFFFLHFCHSCRYQLLLLRI